VTRCVAGLSDAVGHLRAFGHVRYRVGWIGNPVLHPLEHTMAALQRLQKYLPCRHFLAEAR